MTIGDSAFLRAPACCGRLPAVALLFCFAALTSLAAASDEIGSTPPPIYTRELAKQLTPLKTAVTFTSATLEDKAPALTLLEERIYRVDETGRRVVARQVVRKSRTDAGAHVNAEEIFIFRKHEQRFYLVLAEAIQPDGAVQPVKDSAILVQSPQRQAQYALYDDQAEVRVIFPNVKPGTVTHAIVVAEDIEPRMPGEFANTFSWSATWPIGEVRYVVDLPDALASRLQILTLGADVPAPTRENLRGARTRYTVVKEKISPVRDEYNPAPAEQFGPCLHLTTIADWDAVGRWYSGLLQGRDRLTPLLAVKVDAWASGAPTPEAVTQALFTKVADDVRYTGLEFGEADYRPHDCNEVWENQYGDCKDKANLLVAFLRHRGIEAFVTLVNAANAGVIDRRAPDFQAFTHAIVALPGPGGAYTFCDPTLAYARPGLLAPSDADREVLVITANGATWARTPPQSGGKFAYDFDLKMQPNGELVGWVSITGTEYYAATGQTWFRRLDTNEQRRAMSDLLRSFYPGAEVIDVVKPSEEAASHATYTVKAYFLVPRSLEAGAGRQNLVFPNPQSLFGPLGSNKERSTPLFLQRGVIAIRCVMRLPEGQTPELPAPFAVATPAGPVRAAWRFTAPDCRAEFEWETTESLVSATQFGDYYVAMDSLRSWLSKPVSLTSTGRAPPPAAATLVLDDFPRMPTGDGQLQLLQTRYPATGNLNLRKAALEATLQYFPDDKSTVFRVGVLLSELEWMVGHKAEAVSRLQLLLPAYRRELAPDVVAWGEVSLAWSLEHLDQADAAQLIYVRLAGNSELPQDLRAKAAVSAALLLKKKDPTGALAVLEPVAGWPTSAQAAAYAEIIYCLLATDRSADARSRLATLVETRPDAVVDLLAKIARATAGWTATSDGAAQEKLLSWIKELAPRGSPALDAALTDARTRRNSERVLGQIRDDLARQMAGPPLASWYTPAADAVLKSDEEFEQAENEAQQKNDLSRALQLSVQSALTLPPDANLPRRLWRAAVFLEAKEQADNRPLDDAVADAVLGASEKLPQDEAVFQTARLIHAEHHMLRGEYSAAAQLCREVLALPLSLERIRPLTGVLLGRCLEHVGDLEGALAVYINLEKYAASMPEAAGTQLRAVFLELQLGRSAEAAARVRLLAGLSETAWQKAEGAEQIRQLIILHRSGKAEEFWARRAKWWADWETFARELKLPAPGPDATIPVVLNERDWGIAMGQALRLADRTAFFQQLRIGVSAARWLPDYISNVVGLMVYLPRIAPEQLTSFRRLGLQMLETAQDDLGNADGRRGRRLLRAANLLDDSRAATALAALAELRGDLGANLAMKIAAHRVWGAAALATGTERVESADALAADLRDPGEVPERPAVVLLLDQLYRGLEAPKDELALLARELEHPAVKADSAVYGQLSARATYLNTKPWGASSPAPAPPSAVGAAPALGISQKQAFAGPVASGVPLIMTVPASTEPTFRGAPLVPSAPAESLFSEQVADWVRRNKPSWYDLAQVGTADARRPSEQLAAPGTQLHPTEVIKLQFLAAQDKTLSADARVTAWLNGIQAWLRLVPTETAAREIVASALDERAFGENERVRLLWVALSDALAQGAGDTYQKLAQHPLAGRLGPSQREALPLYAKFLEIDKRRPATVLEFVRNLPRDHLRMAHLYLINHALNVLAGFGAVEEVRALDDLLGHATLAPELKGAGDALRLATSRVLRNLEDWGPLHEALRRQTLEAFPHAPSTMPAGYVRLRTTVRLRTQEAKETLQYGLYLARTGEFSRQNLRFWSGLAQAAAHASNAEDFPLQLLRTGLAAAKNDSQRQEVVDFLGSAVDIDDEAARAEVTKMFAEWRQPARSPLTYAQIRFWEIAVALRRGDPVDLASAYEGLNHTRARGLRIRQSLALWTRTSDRDALRQFFDTLNPTELFEPQYLAVALPAFEVAGLKTEADMARQAARKELLRAVVDAWASDGQSGLPQVCTLIEVLAEPTLLPQHWYEDMRNKATDPIQRGRLTLTAAWLFQEWADAVKQAQALRRLQPRNYTLLWYEGAAQAKLGRTAEAVQCLRQYVTIAKDERTYPDAVALLASLAQAERGRGMR